MPNWVDYGNATELPDPKEPAPRKKPDESARRSS